MSNRPDWVGESLRRQREEYLRQVKAALSTPVVPDPPVDDSDEEVPTGVMIALFPTPEVARQLAVKGGEKAKNLHITLAYLGKQDEVGDLAALAPHLEIAAVHHGPLKGEVSGHGYFTGNGDGVVTYAGVDLPGLPELRHDLVKAAEGAGYSVSRDHGFTPHMTLAYGDKRDLTLPNLPLEFSHVVLASGKDRAMFPLCGGYGQMAADSADSDANDTAKGKHHYTHPDYVPGAGIEDGAMPDCVECGKPFGDEIHLIDDSGELPGRAPVTTVPRVNPLQISTEEPESQRAFITQYNGRTIFTAPATASNEAPLIWERAASSNDFMLWMQGRFVGGEVPNRNNAFWTTGDLEMGEPTVQYGPLNWLHEERHIIGCIADAKMVLPEQSADAKQIGQPYIAVLTPIYKWIYPNEATVVQQASESGHLWYSMECVSKAVECVGDAGCGASVPYVDYMTRTQNTCAHMRERAGVRRFVDPTFLGGAVIVPPVRPGWADAEASVLRQNSALIERAYEQAGRPDMPALEWESLMAQVLRFAS